jgi:hypothetical protein
MLTEAINLLVEVIKSRLLILPVQDQIICLRPPQLVPSESVITGVYEEYVGAPGRASFKSAVLGWDANMASDPSPRSGKSHHS